MCHIPGYFVCLVSSYFFCPVPTLCKTLVFHSLDVIKTQVKTFIFFRSAEGGGLRMDIVNIRQSSFACQSADWKMASMLKTDFRWFV